ncbi:SAM-dependent methyltransferase [Allostreptomyces psammosilenae]|uniref:SAM-dependent methyltransferase n=1 Tax=Allostreptomyces psammosilenae TaxID=1892865 RepID=A0A853A0P8_9ACTN|nr:SAM-dependent methyltransferase [Allostreptomyces psammosilenae]NYI07949.1 SAM-dependent methyltransferase [Allostreptomyces psammosilenae]
MAADGPIDLRTDVPHSARMYNYFLGGKDNFPADREAAEKVLAIAPSIRTGAIANRRFLGSAVTYLVREAGIRQFLDIGTGIPTEDNTHEVAQSLAPDARIVYVDNDPIVLAHARALLKSSPEGRTAYIDADLRDPRSILDHPDLRATLDLTQPVALMFIATLHFVPDEEAYPVVQTLMDALPSGSHLVISHATADFPSTAFQEIVKVYTASGITLVTRTKAEVERFYTGMELAGEGVSPYWPYPEGAERPREEDLGGYIAVGRKP